MSEPTSAAANDNLAAATPEVKLERPMRFEQDKDHSTRYWILGIIGVLALYAIIASSVVVSAKNTVDARWSDIAVTCQRRADLIPQLNQVVVAAGRYESSTLTAQTRLRQIQAAAPQAPTDGNDAARQRFLEASAQTARAIQVVVEAYPQLRATEGFRDFQAQIEGTENRIAVARRDYNKAVLSYNNIIEMPLTALFARSLRRRQMFVANPATNAPPTLQFDQPAAQ